MKTIEKLFVSHELAKTLKEFCFNEECCNYQEQSKKKTRMQLGYSSEWIDWNIYPNYTSIPMYVQVTEWLMDKHQIFVSIQTDCTTYPKFAFEVNQFYGNPKNLAEKEWGWKHTKPHAWFLYRTYNEALTEAIKFSLTLINK